MTYLVADDNPTEHAGLFVERKFASAGERAENAPREREVSPVHRAEQFGPNHGHVLGVTGADVEMAFIGASAATHADVHEQPEGPVAGGAIFQAVEDDLLPARRELPVLVEGGDRAVAEAEDVGLDGQRIIIGVQAGGELRHADGVLVGMSGPPAMHEAGGLVLLVLLECRERACVQLGVGAARAQRGHAANGQFRPRQRHGVAGTLHRRHQRRQRRGIGRSKRHRLVRRHAGQNVRLQARGA